MYFLHLGYLQFWKWRGYSRIYLNSRLQCSCFPLLLMASQQHPQIKHGWPFHHIVGNSLFKTVLAHSAAFFLKEHQVPTFSALHLSGTHISKPVAPEPRHTYSSSLICYWISVNETTIASRASSACQNSCASGAPYTVRSSTEIKTVCKFKYPEKEELLFDNHLALGVLYLRKNASTCAQGWNWLPALNWCHLIKYSYFGRFNFEYFEWASGFSNVIAKTSGGLN